MKECSDIQLGWAVGGGDFIYPEDMGAPFFETEMKYALIEMHYDNSDLHKGQLSFISNTVISHRLLEKNQRIIIEVFQMLSTAARFVFI